MQLFVNYEGARRQLAAIALQRLLVSNMRHLESASDAFEYDGRSLVVQYDIRPPTAEVPTAAAAAPAAAIPQPLAKTCISTMTSCPLLQTPARASTAVTPPTGLTQRSSMSCGLSGGGGGEPGVNGSQEKAGYSLDARLALTPWLAWPRD